MRQDKAEGSTVLERKLFSFDYSCISHEAFKFAIFRSIRLKETARAEEIEANEAVQKRLEELQAQLEVCNMNRSAFWEVSLQDCDSIELFYY